ncbi:hypothetical protein ANANG_G00251240 [Anguilla anguilla]|uniref:Uncharacterized protein n=1 Tax=Anguilla anguilla TaxID=7936 RepID=A0A9D3LTS4_ANGAN|nr:hypothetical protein ANANG_G00251240 [Anguilla anguilla]
MVCELALRSAHTLKQQPLACRLNQRLTCGINRSRRRCLWCSWGMDANPAISLSLLYRNDPIYSLCASDLMTASQTVNNNFIKEQKQLIKTLKKLEQQKLLRMRQLNEEKKQFAALMRRKLSQRGSSAQTAFGPSAFMPECSNRASSAPVCHFPAPSHRENSAKNSTISKTSTYSTLSKYSPSPQQPLSLDTQRSIGVKMYVNSTRGVCKCGHSCKLLTRSESCLPVLQ